MLRTLLIAIALVGLTGHARAAVCGDGILDFDAGEQCDPGGTTTGTYWQCCSATCQRLDADGDGLCDDEDLCTQSYLARLTEATLRVDRIGPPTGDERMRFTGRLRFPPSAFVDPAVAGFRFSLHGETSTVLETTITPMIAARIPGGVGWSTGNSTWRFRDPKGRYAGVTSVALKLITPAPVVPNYPKMTLAYTITARRGGYVVTPDMVELYDFDDPTTWGQLQTTMALGSAADGAETCAQHAFPSYVVLPTVPCTENRRGTTITCGSPPPIGPCQVGEPRDVLACEVLAVATAQEAYKAAHGTYWSGPGGCAGLPGYTPTPEALISCAVTGSTFAFAIAAASPYTPNYYCYYLSTATPALTCS